MDYGFSRTDPRIALPWIVRLRYAVAVGQFAVCFLADRVLGIPLPLRWLALVPLLIALSNLWLSERCDKTGGVDRGSTVIGWIFVLDTLCLTAVLMLSGGPNNPFSLLCLGHITLAAGTVIRFEVVDSGPGVRPEVLQRAGEPFFTTKEPGKGMGPGIFLVCTLAECLNGRFELLSCPGAGARAVLELLCQRADQATPVEVRK